MTNGLMPALLKPSFTYTDVVPFAFQTPGKAPWKPSKINLSLLWPLDPICTFLLYALVRLVVATRYYCSPALLALTPPGDTEPARRHGGCLAQPCDRCGLSGCWGMARAEIDPRNVRKNPTNARKFPQTSAKIKSVLFRSHLD